MYHTSRRECGLDVVSASVIVEVPTRGEDMAVVLVIRGMGRDRVNARWYDLGKDHVANFGG